MDGIKPVLAADDNPDDLRLLQFAWRSANASAPLEVVQGGEEIIAYLSGSDRFADRRLYPLPQLLLLDLKMPRKDGFEVLQWIRGRPGLKRLPVVVLTASLHKEDVQRAFDVGASAFLVKPVELQQLVQMVKAIDGFWIAHSQTPNLLARQ